MIRLNLYEYNDHRGLEECENAMNCNIQGVYMNLRYRVLTINDEHYILDIGGRSFWKIIFPFFHWILPTTVYKVNDHELIEKIVSPDIKQKSVGWQSVLGGVLALGLSRLLQPFVDYLDIKSTPFINSIIVSIVILLVLSFFLYVNMRSGKKLNESIHLDRYPKVKLWIRPHSTKYFFHMFFAYFFSLALTVLFLAGFIQLPNGLILFAGTLLLFILFAINFIIIKVGDTTVRFKEK